MSCIYSAPAAPILIDITRDEVGNNTASVRILFEPPECLLSDPDCVSFYRVFYTEANTTSGDLVTRDFDKDEAVEADVKPRRMVSGRFPKKRLLLSNLQEASNKLSLILKVIGKFGSDSFIQHADTRVF